MQNKIGILLVNLGTPCSPKRKDVARYLIEFLTDKRVFDFPWIKRQFLVRGLIVPRRCKATAKSYQKIWTKEGSPLLVYGNRLKENLQNMLGAPYIVELGMRYQQPSIAEKLDVLMQNEIDHLIVVPLFPQYASATTGSALQKVQECLSRYRYIPKITLISDFATDPGVIEAFCSVAKDYDLNQYDHVLFSFHGLPARDVINADKRKTCLSKGCCLTWQEKNWQCYSAQCHATARAIVERLSISQNKWTLCFQSRLGKEPWLSPYTSQTIQDLAKGGKKRLLVFSPSFVCDCLETIYEIQEEYAAEFKHLGGEKLDLVPGLNDHPAWISAVANLVRSVS